MPSPLAITLRRGRLDDLRSIRTFTRDTFSWGDYLPGTWNDWVKARNGVLIVAEVDGVIVGTVHVTFLGNGEAWLEGLRVRHRARRAGIATALVQGVHTLARRKGCAVIRLETGVWNTGARRVFARFGYRGVVECAYFVAEAGQGEFTLRHAKPTDAPILWEAWVRSWLYQHEHRLVPSNTGWRWWQWTRSRLDQAIQTRTIWVTQDFPARPAWMMTRASDKLEITLWVGRDGAVQHLLAQARVLAERQGCQAVGWIVPPHALAKRWASQTGYTLYEDGLLIHECVL